MFLTFQSVMKRSGFLYPIGITKICEDECECEKNIHNVVLFEDIESIYDKKNYNYNLMKTISGFISISQDQSKDIITKGS